jgi:hypothetical protein
MGPKKLQIFLSSTYTDLVDLRLSAIEAILAAGHIPATMEQFSPGDETALEVIRRWIADSDAFILILGGRLGSIEPKSGKGYVQVEYDLAVEMKKPLFAMVMSEDLFQQRIVERGVTTVDEREHQAEYKAFRRGVMQKLCSTFNDAKDVRSTIFQKLPEWAQRNDLIGWVRASDAMSPEMAEELARLSKENASLRTAAANSASEQFDGVTFEQMVGILKAHTIPEKLRRSAFGDNIVHAGLLFDAILDRIGMGIEMPKVHHKGHSRTRNLMGILAEDGLIVVTEGFDDATYLDVCQLTDTGRRFRNRLLAMGPRETRLKELWSA